MSAAFTVALRTYSHSGIAAFQALREALLAMANAFCLACIDCQRFFLITEKAQPSGCAFHCNLRTRLVGNVYELAERVHIVYGEIRKNLAVYIHAGQLEAIDHAAVSCAADASTRVDARDP